MEMELSKISKKEGDDDSGFYFGLLAFVLFVILWPFDYTIVTFAD